MFELTETLKAFRNAVNKLAICKMEAVIDITLLQLQYDDTNDTQLSKQSE